MIAFIKINNSWNISTHFTLFKSNFIDITLGNYSQVKTTNLKVLLFIVASSVTNSHKEFCEAFTLYHLFSPQIFEITPYTCPSQYHC